MTGNEFVDGLRASLTRLHTEAAALIQANGPDPLPGSLAASEFASYPRPESIATVSAIGVTLLESVAEHLTTFVKTVTEPVEPIACWTCVRSMLESAAIAAWLFDPAVDAQTRVGRSFAYRYEGLTQLVKFLRAINRPAVEVQAAVTNIEKLENVAAGLGFPRMRNSKKEIIGVGQRTLPATEMIKLVLDEERAYRLLSAVAHGHTWAILELGFQKGDTSTAGGVTTTAMKKHSGTVQGYGFLAVRAAKSLGLPLWNQCRYYGWDKERLAALLDLVYDQLHGTAAVRFWKAP